MACLGRRDASLMVVRCIGLLVLLALTACGHASEVKRRFAHEYDCNHVEVKAVSNSTFVASGCSAEATYTCAGGTGDSVCVREYTNRDLKRISAPAAVVVRQDPDG